MGHLAVEVELANNQDLNLAERGFLPGEQVRRTKVRGVVDTGATHLVIPAAIAAQLGLTITGEVNGYADGRAERRPVAGNVHLS